MPFLSPPCPRFVQVWLVLQVSPGSQADPHVRRRWMQLSPTGHWAFDTQLLVVVVLQPPVGSSEMLQKAQSAFEVQVRLVETLQRPGATMTLFGSCHSVTPPALKSMAIS